MMGADGRMDAPIDRNDHQVCFYPSDHALAETVAGFFASGFEAGGAVVAVVTPAHRALLAESLAARGVDVGALRASGRLVELDCDETLDRLLFGGAPTWRLFEEVFSETLARAERACARGAVRAFGEMVDVLWQRGDLAAALELERLWHRLLRGHGVPLLCAYRADVVGERRPDSLERLLAARAHVVPSAANLADAVERALADVIGPGEAENLAPLIAANQIPGPRLARGEAVIFWLRRNLPHRVPAVMARARAILLSAL